MGPEGPVFDGTGDWGTAFGAWGAAAATPPPDGPGATIQELIEALEAVEVLGRPEGERSYRLQRAKDGAGSDAPGTSGTVIKCHCGDVAMRLPADKPMHYNECMCVDCLDRLV